MAEDYAPTESVSPSLKMKKHRIIIIDDNRDFADIFSDVLKANGHSTKSCYGGKEALDLVEKDTYDIAFIDIMMPDMNGVEVLKELKVRFPDTVVIMMTGYSVDEMIHKAMKEKASDIIYKPFEIEKVLSLLDTIE